MINADISMMPIHVFRSILADPLFEAAGFFRFTEHPTEDRICELSVSASFSHNTPTPSRHGAQGTEIPREIGYSEEEIARLRSGNIVGPIAPGLGRNHGKTREGRS